MKELYAIKDVLEDQIKKIAAKGDAITPQELDSTYKVVDIIKDIEEIDAMCRAKDMEENGYSMNRGNSYDTYYKPRFAISPPMGPYDGPDDYSGRRGRDMNTGRYTSRDGYSGHDSKESLMREMEELKLKLASM